MKPATYYSRYYVRKDKWVVFARHAPQQIGTAIKAFSDRVEADKYVVFRQSGRLGE